MDDLFIETRGRGPHHIVMLHGWALHGGIFAPLVAEFEADCTLHLVDLPGHGHSHASAVALEPEAIARAVLDATPPALWLGWSLGGLVALQAALDRPDRVRALAMISASPCFIRKPDWGLGVERAVFDAFGGDFQRDYRAGLERFLALEALGSEATAKVIGGLRDELYARQPPAPATLATGLAAIAHADLRARLAQLRQPSVWIAGKRDRLVPPPAMAWAAEACDGAFCLIEHAGHAPFLGHAASVAAAVRPLLERPS